MKNKQKYIKEFCNYENDLGKLLTVTIGIAEIVTQDSNTYNITNGEGSFKNSKQVDKSKWVSSSFNLQQIRKEYSLFIQDNCYLYIDNGPHILYTIKRLEYDENGNTSYLVQSGYGDTCLYNSDDPTSRLVFKTNTKNILVVASRGFQASYQNAIEPPYPQNLKMWYIIHNSSQPSMNQWTNIRMDQFGDWVNFDFIDSKINPDMNPSRVADDLNDPSTRTILQRGTPINPPPSWNL